MRKFAVLLLFIAFLGFLGVVADIYIKIQSDRMNFWKYEWFIESYWFSLFTLFMIAVMILMRPNEKSKLLAMVF